MWFILLNRPYSTYGFWLWWWRINQRFMEWIISLGHQKFESSVFLCLLDWFNSLYVRLIQQSLCMSLWFSSLYVWFNNLYVCPFDSTLFMSVCLIQQSLCLIVWFSLYMCEFKLSARNCADSKEMVKMMKKFDWYKYISNWPSWLCLCLCLVPVPLIVIAQWTNLYKMQ